MGEALSRVSQVKHVPVDLARKYGLYGEDDNDILAALENGDEGNVDIPCWRHAIINFPHPLLRQGLVILDTPGLNAIGTEPELTLNLLPNAHALLFILAADTGVTKTDLDVWNQHLAGEDPATRAGRIVILNKIDGLWDDLKSSEAVDAGDRTPGAQHGPAARRAAGTGLRDLGAEGPGRQGQRRRCPARQEPLAGAGNFAVAETHPRQARHRRRSVAGRRARADRVGALDTRRPLGGRGRAAERTEGPARQESREIVGHMMARVREEKELFERGLARFTALRNVFTQQTNELFDHVGLETLRANAARTRRHIEDSPFTRGVRGAMNDFFGSIKGDFAAAGRQSAETHEMMRAMYARLAKEHGLEPFNPPAFSVLKYQKEIERLERAYNTHFNTLWNMVSKAKFALMKRFFETSRRASSTSMTSPTATSRHGRRRSCRRWKRRSASTTCNCAGASTASSASTTPAMNSRSASSNSSSRRPRTLQIKGLMQVTGIDLIVDQPDTLPLAANG